MKIIKLINEKNRLNIKKNKQSFYNLSKIEQGWISLLLSFTTTTTKLLIHLLLEFFNDFPIKVKSHAATKATIKAQYFA